MINKNISLCFIGALLLCCFSSCKIPEMALRKENRYVPESFNASADTSNPAGISWRAYFGDPNLVALIDTALQNNQELNITLREIEIGSNEVMVRKGEYRPFVQLMGGVGFEKDGRYTRHGAVDEQLTIKEGKKIPEPLPDMMIGAFASWEIDVWKKLRNAKKAAVLRYLSSIEGKNYLITRLIAEISSSYYELLALDNQLEIIQRNIEIQENALHIIKQQKEYAKATQLAVNRFEAQLLHTQNLQYAIRQQIIETENRLNYLAGRFPQTIKRNASDIIQYGTETVHAGIPSRLLENRPDIRRAEMELEASKLDVSIARASFYPSFRLTAGIGLQAFNAAYLVKPESILYNLAGDLVAPLVNKNAIKAAFATANARQAQAVYEYERTILNAHIEVLNQLSRIENFSKSEETTSKEVEILTQSITISNNLFRSARADYMEVLLTQREALESRIDLVEIRLKRQLAKVNIYQALGGGWN